MLELPKSPSGSLCPYYYLGGELHPLKYGNYGTNRKRLQAVLNAEQEFILASTGTRNRRIWVDLYQTDLDDATIAMLVDHLDAIRPKILKLCLVGCSFRARRRVRAVMRRRTPELHSATRYFSDPEDAKRWLVGRRDG
ncbi:MAG: hypothetical protein J0I14_04835 [Propionibacteriaceae bacterium]|jgi:hypothetical protein|nr:hypothetical protein [Propionibacteriaceae bacterium]